MAVAGLEKFSHLEDKIYRTVELNGLQVEKDRLETQVERLLADRDAMRLKVEAMLDAIAVLEMEAEYTRK